MKMLLCRLMAAPLLHWFGPRFTGAATAYIEFWRGDYRVHVYGLSSMDQETVSLLKDEYGIEVRTVACCPHSRFIREHTEGHNSVVVRAIKERFPPEVIRLLD